MAISIMPAGRWRCADLLDLARHGERGEPTVPVIGPDESDRFLLDTIEEQQKLFGLTGLRNITPDRWLTEGEAVEVAGFRFDVYHVPGHSPGSVVFVEPGQPDRLCRRHAVSVTASAGTIFRMAMATSWWPG